MKILVTGGAGYIGSIAVEYLLDRGFDVVVVDNLWRGQRSALSPDIEFHQCDLRDLETTEKVVAQTHADAVIHFAGATLVGESIQHPDKYFAVNVVGSHNLLNAVRKSGIQRFVFSSTAAVYGMPTQLPIVETAPTIPINPYGQSKLMVEQMLEWYGRAYDLHWAALRYFNVAGATVHHGEDHDPETHIIPVALQTLLGKRDRFRVFGTDYATADGTAIRDYVHVIDLVDAHLRALQRLNQVIGPLNLGTTTGFSVKQIVEAVEKITGRTLPLEYDARRPGDPPVLIADSTRARGKLDWQPNHSTLDEMIGSAWEWYQRNPSGYPKS